MSVLEIEMIGALSDNYVYLLRCPETGAVGVVDPSEAAPVLSACERLGWKITHILNTHHHADHTGGNLELKSTFGATVVGPKADEARIAGIDVALAEGDTYDLGNATFRVFDTPGHTSGHIALWFEDSQALFSGDTLFALGCGRLFEGSAAQMWESLSKLKVLPPETRVYCGHEYTQSNARFAVTVDPANAALKQRADEIDALRAKGQPTIPSTIGLELETNPFLRPDDAGVQTALGMSGGDVIEVFAEIRRRKDTA